MRHLIHIHEYLSCDQRTTIVTTFYNGVSFEFEIESEELYPAVVALIMPATRSNMLAAYRASRTWERALRDEYELGRLVKVTHTSKTTYTVLSMYNQVSLLRLDDYRFDKNRIEVCESRTKCTPPLKVKRKLTHGGRRNAG